MKDNLYVIGAGIFGVSIAIELAKSGLEPILIERESSILSKASRNNHNRIHYGYHYPRSRETAEQSLKCLSSFISEYQESIRYNFDNYYAISKTDSKVSSEQYEAFMDSVNIDYLEEKIDGSLINNDLISKCYKVQEPVYDIDILRRICEEKLSEMNIEIRFNTDFNEIILNENDWVINCTYSNINTILEHFNEQSIPGIYQEILIPVFQYKSAPFGLTIMDGPFCSIMPRGKNPNEFLLYHVVEGVLNSSSQDFSLKSEKPNLKMSENIIKKSVKYYPFLKDVNVVDCYYMKRFISTNSTDDERTSQIYIGKKNPRLISVFSGKVTTAVSIGKSIRNYIQGGRIKSIYV